jgi:hypothetical protein
MHARVTAFIFLAALLAGCAGEAPDEPPRAAIPAWTGDPVFRDPWLRDALPAKALFYQRLPNPGALLAAPKGGIFGEAMASSANAQSTAAILAALGGTLAELPDGMAGTLAEVANRVRSPLEFAAIASPRPTLLTALTVDMRSIGELQTAFALLAEAGTGIALLDTPDFDGYAELAGLPVPTVLRFDSANGRLLLLSGQGLGLEAARRLAAQLDDGGGHPMHAMESRIDESGQGLLFWIDVERALPMAQLFLPPETYATIESLQLDKVRSAAYGFGIAGGKGRLGVALDLGDNRAAQPVPMLRSQIAARAVGAPDAVVLLSLPDVEEYRRLEAILLASVDAETRGEWQDIKSMLADTYRFDIEAVLTAIGPDVLGIFDAAGDYTALRVRDAERFDALVTGLSTLPHARYTSTQHDGVTIHHLRLPDVTVAAGEAAGLAERLATHLYWVRDGDYIYLSDVPQSLVDRARRGAESSVSDWLANEQGIDASASALLLTTRFDKAPRRLYHSYLTGLQFLADLTGANFDAFAMPTADDLGLAEDAAVGFHVSLGDPIVSMELVYDSNPGAIAVGFGPQFAAMGGIVAAVAIPAYQDYAVRSQVAEGLALASVARVAVEEVVLNTGAFPDAETIAGWELALAGDYVSDVSVLPDSGIIVIRYDNDASHAALRGDAAVYVEPVLTGDGGITWVCSGTVEPRYLSSQCRGNPLPAAVAVDAMSGELSL